MPGGYHMLGSGSKKHVVLIILVTLFFAAFIVLATPARSFTPAQGVLVEYSQQQEAKSHDPCAALLNETRQLSDAAPLQDAVLHVDASPAAALSLMLGVRYALGPTESAGGATRALHYGAESGAALHPDLSGQRARAVAEYRACRNDLLLKAL